MLTKKEFEKMYGADDRSYKDIYKQEMRRCRGNYAAAHAAAKKRYDLLVSRPQKNTKESITLYSAAGEVIAKIEK